MAGGKKRFATVDCAKHGTVDFRKGIQSDIRRVKVSIPNTKKRRLYGGCPKCKAEAIAAKRLAEIIVQEV